MSDLQAIRIYRCVRVYPGVTLNEIIERTQLKPTIVRKKLAKLKKEGVVKSERRGKNVYYDLGPRKEVEEIAERETSLPMLPEKETYFYSYKEYPIRNAYGDVGVLGSEIESGMRRSSPIGLEEENRARRDEERGRKVLDGAKTSGAQKNALHREIKRLCQDEAERLWQKNPHLSKSDIARAINKNIAKLNDETNEDWSENHPLKELALLVHDNFSFRPKVDTIRRLINKPQS